MTRGIDIMRNHIGQQEVRDRLILMKFLKDHSVNGDITIDPSLVSWCSAMINACQRAAGYRGTGSLMARSWLKYGIPVSSQDAQEGDIVIFDFEHDNIHGHVTYFVGWDHPNNLIKCLGGNQHNMVTESAYIKDAVIGIRRSLVAV